MTVSYTDFISPNVPFFADVNQNRTFTTNSRNYINVLGAKQLRTIGNASLLDVFFSKGHYVEPHYHQNATELVYCVAGAANVSFLNPFTKKMHFVTIRPGQAASVPQGWWHYEEAMEDDSHIIAIFDAPTPEVVLGSDILRLTPARAMAETYCLDEAKWREAIAPITKTVGIGPLDNCRKSAAAERESEVASGKPPGRAQQAPNGARPSSSSSASVPQTQAAPNRAPAPAPYPPPGYPYPPAPGYSGGRAPYAFPPVAYVYPHGYAATHPNAWPQPQPPHPFPFRPHPQPQPRP
jgi:quercetin dioxygenase-like cupin family protein